MSKRRRAVHVPLDYGNPVDKRLSSYRMSMLAHGFVQEHDSEEFVPDKSGPLSYAVVALGRGWSVALAIGVVAIAAVLAAVLLLA